MDDRRIDHFAHLRPDVTAPPPEKDMPVVRPDLVEYLEAAFAPPPPAAPTSHDEMLAETVRCARFLGQHDVIAFIRNLVRGA